MLSNEAQLRQIYMAYLARMRPTIIERLLAASKPAPYLPSSDTLFVWPTKMPDSSKLIFTVFIWAKTINILAAVSLESPPLMRFETTVA
jgi:hypothetical protein